MPTRSNNSRDKLSGWILNADVSGQPQWLGGGQAVKIRGSRGRRSRGQRPHQCPRRPRPRRRGRGQRWSENPFVARPPPSLPPLLYDGFVFPNGQIATTRLKKYTSSLRCKKLSSKLRHMKIIPQIRKQKKRGGTRAYIDINFENTNPELIDWFSNSINQFLILNYRCCAVTYETTTSPPPTACWRSKTFNTLEFLITLSGVWEQVN